MGQGPVAFGEQPGFFQLVRLVEQTLLGAVEQGVHIVLVAHRQALVRVDDARVVQLPFGGFRVHLHPQRVHVPVLHRIGVVALADQQQTLLQGGVLVRHAGGAVQAQCFRHAGRPARDHACLAVDALAGQGQGDQHPVAVPVQHPVVGGDLGQPPQGGAGLPGVAGPWIVGQRHRGGGGLVEQLLHLVAEAFHHFLVQGRIGDAGFGDFAVFHPAQRAGVEEAAQRLGALAQPLQMTGVQLAGTDTQPGQGGADPQAATGALVHPVAHDRLQAHVLVVVAVVGRQGLVGHQQEVVFVIGLGGTVVLTGGEQEKAEKRQ